MTPGKGEPAQYSGSERVRPLISVQEKAMSSHEHRIKSQMKAGAGVALLGLLCPFFWLSYFSGTGGSETWIYGLHSGAFMVLGLALLGKGWYDLKTP